MRASRLLQRLRDNRGATAVEFALVTPPFLLLLVGTMDFGHTIWMRSTVEGALQEAARDSGLESGAVLQGQQIIDNKIRNTIVGVAKNATVDIKRGYYKTFTDASAARQEDYTDTSGNNWCDAGEPYVDRNNNGKWDWNGADDGQGGAKDIVVITVKVKYPRLFPMSGLLGLPDQVIANTNSVLANQPYGEQTTNGPGTNRNCPLGVTNRPTDLS
jgi:Flp pilus assembly pilin Flp